MVVEGWRNKAMIVSSQPCYLQLRRVKSDLVLVMSADEKGKYIAMCLHHDMQLDFRRGHQVMHLREKIVQEHFGD